MALVEESSKLTFCRFNPHLERELRVASVQRITVIEIGITSVTVETKRTAPNRFCRFTPLLVKVAKHLKPLHIIRVEVRTVFRIQRLPHRACHSIRKFGRGYDVRLHHQD